MPMDAPPGIFQVSQRTHAAVANEFGAAGARRRALVLVVVEDLPIAFLPREHFGCVSLSS
jgi:hypothetical protein